MTRWTKRTTRQKTFVLLREGYSQGSIGRKLHRSHQAIGRYIKEFENQHLMVCEDKNAYIRTYHLTPLGKSVNVTILSGRKRIKESVRLAVSRQGPSAPSNNIHRICRIMNILSEPTLRPGLKWSRESKMANGVIQKYLYWPNKKEDHVTFRYQPEKEGFGKLVFWTPEKRLDSNEWAFWYEYLKEEIGHVYGLAMRLFQCNLALPEEYQGHEFAVPARTEAQRRACKLRLECGKAYTDWSKHGLPDKIRGEFETRDPAVAEALDILVNADHLIPQRVKKIEELWEMWKEVPPKVDQLEKESDEIRRLLEEQIIVTKRLEKTAEELHQTQKKMMIGVPETEKYDNAISYA